MCHFRCVASLRELFPHVVRVMHDLAAFINARPQVKREPCTLLASCCCTASTVDSSAHARLLVVVHNVWLLVSRCWVGHTGPLL
jgi:hypothetical protein